MLRCKSVNRIGLLPASIVKHNHVRNYIGQIRQNRNTCVRNRKPDIITLAVTMSHNFALLDTPLGV